MNRKRFKDVRTAELPPKLVKPKPGESYKQRHARRKATAAMCRKALEEYCESRGLVLHVSNNEHHWGFYVGKFEFGNPWAEWWPSTAKLVFKKQYRRGIHCHDYLQLIVECERELKTQNALRAALPTGGIGAQSDRSELEVPYGT